MNLSLSPEIDLVIGYLSKRDNVPEATKALELLKQGIEYEEDEVFDRLVAERDTPDAKFVSHDQAWL